MAGEFSHLSVGTQLTQAEYEAIGGHVFNLQAIGDMPYASTASQISRIAIGGTNAVLRVSGGVPTWSTTLSGLTLTSPTITSPVVNTQLTGTAVGTGASQVAAGNHTHSIYAELAAQNNFTDMQFINDTANANMTTGLTINLGNNNLEGFAVKSSTVAHGVTTEAETDTFFSLSRAVSTGGTFIRAIHGSVSANSAALTFSAINTTLNTLKSVSAWGIILLHGWVKSGTGTAAPSGTTANSNLVAVHDGGQARFILDCEGDSHQDVGTAWTNFDGQDDLGLLNTLAAHVTRPSDPLREGFGQWLQQGREPLQALKIVTFNEDGHHFVNMSKLAMLHTGALRQVGRRLEAMEQRLLALDGGHA